MSIAGGKITSPTIVDTHVVVPGDVIIGGSDALFASGQERYLQGYNTYYAVSPTRAPASPTGPTGLPHIVSSVGGLVEVTEMVISVAAPSARYSGEVGDVVVGRIVEVGGNRWRVDIGARQDAVMPVSNVTEVGVLRRRGREDELGMRRIFAENDIIVAEVQRVKLDDGQVTLHTRSVGKYGRMRGIGELVVVKAGLIPKLKRQFYVFVDRAGVGTLSSATGQVETDSGGDAAAGRHGSAGAGEPALTDSSHCGVAVVFGANGGVWVSAATRAQIAARHRELAAEEAGEVLGETSDALTEQHRQGESDELRLEADREEAEDRAVFGFIGSNDVDKGIEESHFSIKANAHQMVATVSNVVRVLAANSVPLTPLAVEFALDGVGSHCMSAFDVMQKKNAEMLVALTRQRLSQSGADSVQKGHKRFRSAD